MQVLAGFPDLDAVRDSRVDYAVPKGSAGPSASDLSSVLDGRGRFRASGLKLAEAPTVEGLQGEVASAVS